MLKKKRVPWNKGLKQENDERVRKNSEKRNKTFVRRIKNGEIKQWSKGLTAKEDKRIRKRSEKRNKTLKLHPELIAKPWLGKNLPEDVKTKISKKKKFLYRTGKLKHPRLGVKLSEEIKDKICISKGGDPALRRLSDRHKYSTEFKKKRKFIKLRDGNRCYLCKKKKVKLTVHHIDRNKNNNLSSNLVTLCRSCHGKVTGNSSKYSHSFEAIKNSFDCGMKIPPVEN